MRCSESESVSVVSNSLWPHRLYRPWSSPGQNTGVGSLPFSRGSSQPRHRTQVSHIAGWFFTSWATREAQEYWSRLPIPSPGDLPDPGIEPGSPALQAYSLPTELSGKPRRWRASWNFSYTWRWWNAHSLSLEVPNLKVHKEGTYWIQTTNGLEIFPILPGLGFHLATSLFYLLPSCLCIFNQHAFPICSFLLYHPFFPWSFEVWFFWSHSIAIALLVSNQ